MEKTKAYTIGIEDKEIIENMFRGINTPIGDQVYIHINGGKVTFSKVSERGDNLGINSTKYHFGEKIGDDVNAGGMTYIMIKKDFGGPFPYLVVGVKENGDIDKLKGDDILLMESDNDDIYNTIGLGDDKNTNDMNEMVSGGKKTKGELKAFTKSILSKKSLNDAEWRFIYLEDDPGERTGLISLDEGESLEEYKNKR